MELCRSEVRIRGERDYGLSNIDITSAGADTTSGRRDWITGTFSTRSGSFRRSSSGYRFNCAVDYSSGQVQSVELLRSDGTALTAGSTATTYNQSTTSYDQSRVFRACQDAVVARTARDGYQNVNFSSTAIDTSRTDRVVGAITATRGPVTDTFDFGCTMDLSAASVRNLELNRR